MCTEAFADSWVSGSHEDKLPTAESAQQAGCTSLMSPPLLRPPGPWQGQRRGGVCVIHPPALPYLEMDLLGAVVKAATGKWVKVTASPTPSPTGLGVIGYCSFALTFGTPSVLCRFCLLNLQIFLGANRTA